MADRREMLEAAMADVEIPQDEGKPLENAKIVHWTAGIPVFEHYKNAVGADHWRAEWKNTAYPLAIT